VYQLPDVSINGLLRNGELFRSELGDIARVLFDVGQNVMTNCLADRSWAWHRVFLSSTMLRCILDNIIEDVGQY
jgi:hypothetical protein